MRLILNLVALAMLVGSFQSCVSNKKYNELMAAKEATDQALAETQTQLQDLQDVNQELQGTLESERERLNSEIEDLRGDLSGMKEQVAEVTSKLNMTEGELKNAISQINGAFEAYENSGLKLDRRDGRMIVQTETPIQYRVGSASLSSDERAAIESLANVLKENPELKILVEGYTDDLQYPAGSGYNNWDLSVSRAMSVVKQLLREGVNPDQVAAAGFGESMPVGSNETDEGRSQNRRTEVAPRLNFTPMETNN